jgi:hypothetical protein
MGDNNRSGTIFGRGLYDEMEFSAEGTRADDDQPGTSGRVSSGSVVVLSLLLSLGVVLGY